MKMPPVAKRADSYRPSLSRDKRVTYLRKRAGFTIIELLVVIAIIGILAAIVLGSLSSARAKGNDASVKGELSNIRNSAAEQYYLANGSSYGSSSGTAGSCSDTAGSLGAGAGNGSAMWGDTSSGMKAIIAAIWNVTGASASYMDCGTDANAWSVAVKLPTGGYWCVDSAGKIGNTSNGGSAYATAVVNVAGPHTSAGQTSCN